MSELSAKRANLSRFALVLCSMLAGAIGTAVVISRQHPAPAVEARPPESRQEEEPAENSPIKLSAEAIQTAGIRVETVRTAPIQEGLTVPGTVEVSPDRSAKVTPPASGKVVRLLVHVGDSVRVGQALAVLDSYEVAQAHAAVRQAESGAEQARAGVQTAGAEIAQAQAGAALAQSEIAQARTRQQSAETTLQRQRDLAQAGAFSQAPLQTAQAELAEAQSGLLQAQTELQAHAVVLQRAECLFRVELISRSELEQAQLEQRQDEARVQHAQTRVASAKQTVEREQRVFSGDLLTKQAVQTAEAEVRATIGDVQRAKQGLNRAQQDVLHARKSEQAAQALLHGAENALLAARANLFALEGSGHAEGAGGQLTVSAPVSGVVTERTATVGEAVERTTPLLVIENLQTVLVEAHVPEREVSHVRIGQSVAVTTAAYPEQTFSGVVQSLAGKVDEKTRALTVRCLIENPAGRLRPEMFAQVTLRVGERSQRSVVPASALLEEGEERYLYIETAEGFQRRKVQTGRTLPAGVEITDGLKVGERVVVAGVFTLKSETHRDSLKGDED